MYMKREETRTNKRHSLRHFVAKVENPLEGHHQEGEAAHHLRVVVAVEHQTEEEEEHRREAEERSPVEESAHELHANREASMDLGRTL